MTIPNNRQAPTEYDIMPELKNRWSPRAFSEKMIPRETLLSIFEAARWSMSSYNEQPWRYVVAAKDTPEEYEKIIQCLDDFNQLWAKTAPVLVLGFIKTYFRDDLEKVNKHAGHDLGAASAMLAIEAMRHDVFAHQMAGINVEKIRSMFSIPDGYEPMTAIALGYIGDPSQLPPDIAKGEVAERKRKPLSETVFLGSWDQSIG